MNTNNNYTLQIWKLDAKKELTMGDPCFTMQFGIEGSDEQVHNLASLELEAENLCKQHSPVIDCAGYRGIVLDTDSNEVAVIEKMY